MTGTPYDIYDALHRQAPVLWNPAAASWMVFGYRDVTSALRDPAFSSAARLADMQKEFAQTLSARRARSAAEVFGQQLEMSDPPAHSRIRGALRPQFHAAGAAAPALIREAMEGLPTLIPSTDPIDLMTAFAIPLPQQIVLATLGIPPAGRTDFAGRVELFLRHLSDPTISGSHALEKLREHLATADGGIIGNLTDQLAPISDDELLANAILIVSAGHRTTSNLIGNLLYLLLQHRDVVELLLADLALVPRVVEEALRLESPLQTLQRVATRQTILGGVTIRKCDSVTLVLGAANRDPATYDQCHNFDPRRQPNRHLAFGYGPHFCLGAALARLQAIAVVEHLLPLLPSMRLRSAVWNPQTAARGLVHLIVDYSP